MTGPLAITLFVVGLIAAVMFHEWGHFWTARRFGMRADRFFLGFGPTLWSTRRGETTYGVKLLPAGGFVRIRGMSPTDERRGPLADAVLGVDAGAAEEGGGHGDRQAVSDRTWERLDEELRARGAGRELTRRIVHRTRRNVGRQPTAERVRGVLEEVLATEVGASERVGDLAHRLRRGDEGRFFDDRPAWQRAVVLSAGSVSHFLVAALLLLLGYALLPQTTVVPVVDEVVPDSPAAEAGLRPGDRIVAVGDTRSDSYAELREEIRSHPGEATRFVVERDSRAIRLEVTPAVETGPSGQTFGQVGFRASVAERRLSFTEAVGEAFVGEASLSSITTGTLDAMVRVFGPEGIGSIFEQVAGEEDRPVDSAGSIVGVADVAGEGTARYGWMFLVLTLASVNVFIGVFNILPLPPLDGGHLAVLGIERSVNGVRRVTGRPADFSIDPRAVAAVAVPVIVLIGMISVALLWLDITNPMNLQ